MHGIFHLAFPTAYLERAKQFYGQILGCKPGRESAQWADFDFFGHQLSIHVVPGKVGPKKRYLNTQSHIPANHFGVILKWQDWHDLVEKISQDRINFVLKPTVMYQGEIHEQKTFFLRDPDGNYLEFKTFEDPSRIFTPLS